MHNIRKNIRNRILSLMMFLLVIVSLSPVNFTDESTDSVENSLTEMTSLEMTSLETTRLAYNQNLSQDVLLEGVYGTASMYLSLSPAWEIKEGSYLSLDFATSIPLEFYGSSLTVYLNGQPLKSIFIDSLTENKQHLDIDLPANLLNAGFNEVRIRTYHRMTELICEDDGNPANWVVLYDTSLMHIEYEEKMTDLKLSDFPFPFTKNYNQVPVNFTFISEDNMTEAQYQALHNIAADMGYLNAYKNLDFSVTQIGDYKEDINGIYAGYTVPEAYQTRLESLWSDKTQTDNFIALVPLENNKYILLLIGSDDSYLRMMSKVLMNEQLLSQMSGQIFTFDSSDLLPMPISSNDEIFSFEELGYSDVYTEGSKTSTSTYFLDIPDNWHLDNGAQLVVKARYANVMDLEQSTVIALINNVPIGSYILSKESDTNATFAFDIPKELYNEKSLTLSVKFSLEGDFDCSSGANTSYWTFVSNQSFIYLPHVEKLEYDLTDYPAPFVGNYNLGNLNLTYQTAPSDALLKLGLNIVAFVAHESNNEGDFTISYGTLPSDKNNIVIGTLDQEVVKGLNDSLNFSYDYDSNQFVNKDHLKILNGYNDKLNSIQLLGKSDSPYKTLVLIGPDEVYLSTAGKFLSDFEFVDKLYGNVLMVDSQGLFQTFDTTGKSDQGITISELLSPNTEARASYASGVTFVIIMACLIGAIILLIFIIKKNRKVKL